MNSPRPGAPVRGGQRVLPWLVAVAVLGTGCGSTVASSGVAAGPGTYAGLGGGTAGTGDGVGSTAAGTTNATSATAPGAGLGGTFRTGAGPGATSTSTGAGGVPGATAVAATGPGPASPGLAVSGPGWDRQTVYLGVTTQQDVQKVAQSLGVNSVDSGDQKADAEAIIAHYNANGGLFGRKVKGLYFDISTTGNSETQGQAACTFFTQDNHVVAVYAAALVADTPSFRACMMRAHVPVLAGGGQAFDDQVFNDLQGYYNLMPFPSWNRFAPAFLNRLVAQNYFSTWDTTLGQPGTAPTKVGFLCPDTPIGRRVGALIGHELARVGHPATDATYYATNNSDVSGYVLKFKTDGVSHVLFCDLGLFVFAEQAESQHYRPRYGVSTFNTPVLFLQGVVPAAQLTGAVGSGFDPALDVDEARDPGPGLMPAASECRAIAAKQGVSYGPARRFARAFLYDTCDILGLVISGARAANGLDGPSIRRGIGIKGAALRSALTFASGLSETAHGMPAATRDIGWNSPCQCFEYRSRTIPMQ